MLNRSILDPWDAVCCMDASAVNALLKREFEEQRTLYHADPDAGKHGGLYSSFMEFNYTTPWRLETKNRVTHSVSVPAQISVTYMLHLRPEIQGECVRP